MVCIRLLICRLVVVSFAFASLLVFPSCPNKRCSKRVQLTHGTNPSLTNRTEIRHDGFRSNVYCKLVASLSQTLSSNCSLAASEQFVPPVVKMSAMWVVVVALLKDSHDDALMGAQLEGSFWAGGRLGMLATSDVDTTSDGSPVSATASSEDKITKEESRLRFLQRLMPTRVATRNSSRMHPHPLILVRWFVDTVDLFVFVFVGESGGVLLSMEEKGGKDAEEEDFIMLRSSTCRRDRSWYVLRNTHTVHVLMKGAVSTIWVCCVGVNKINKNKLATVFSFFKISPPGTVQ